jgi:hypothetical protein
LTASDLAREGSSNCIPLLTKIRIVGERLQSVQFTLLRFELTKEMKASHSAPANGLAVGNIIRCLAFSVLT